MTNNEEVVEKGGVQRVASHSYTKDELADRVYSLPGPLSLHESLPPHASLEGARGMF